MSIKINNLNVEINGKQILKNINFEINQGDTILILGPNGHGKSTLLKAIMKHYDTKISSGKIIIDDKIANDWSTDQIANAGVYFAMQYPIEIPGLSTIELYRNEASKDNQKINIVDLYKLINQKMKNLDLNSELLNRNINENFSGGERKKNEILQMQILNPNYILLDEIDSGLDVDAIDLIGKVLVEEQNKNKAIVYISHDNKLFNTLKPNKVILIMNGEIVEIGSFSLAQEIYSIGYSKYAKNKGINLNNEENDVLKQGTKDFFCGTKK